MQQDRRPAATSTERLPLVTVLALGGTISSVPPEGGGDHSGVAPRLTARDLVRAVPQLRSVANVRAVTYRQVPSSDITIPDLLRLVALINRQFKAGADGVVVAQGSDTLEETAFVIDMLITDRRPVVITGAMRNPTMPGADGPANLLAAVRVAASLSAKDLGALAVLNDEIHAARYVRKMHTQSLSAFASPLAGPIGWIAEGRVRIALRPLNRHNLQLSSRARVLPVALLTVPVGDDGRLVDAVASMGFAGLVVEATGGGHVPREYADRLGELAREIPVVLASRTGSGELLSTTYDFIGSEADLLRRGLTPAGVLDGLKARLLLILLLAAGASRRQISKTFAAVGVPEGGA